MIGRAAEPLPIRRPEELLIDPFTGHAANHFAGGQFKDLDVFRKIDDHSQASVGRNLEVIDQFSLGVGIGAALSFADEFKTIDFGLFTASIDATFWW